MKYTVPLSIELSKVETDVHIDDLHGEILRSMWDVSERHLKVKHLSTQGDKNVIKFANKKKLPSHIVEVRKDLNKLSNARKLDDSHKDFSAKRREYRLLMLENVKIQRETKISELCFASDVDEKCSGN